MTRFLKKKKIKLKKKKKKNYISGSSGNGVQHGRKDEREI